MGGEESFRSSFRSLPGSIASTSHLSSSSSSFPSDRHYDATDSRRPLCEYEEFCSPSWRSASSWSTVKSGSFPRIPSLGPQASAHADDDALWEGMQELQEIRREVLSRLGRQGLAAYLLREVQSWLLRVDEAVSLRDMLRKSINPRFLFFWESVAALASRGRALLDALSNVFVGHEHALLQLARSTGEAGHPNVICIRGRKGAGKTRILQELLKEKKIPFDVKIWLTIYSGIPTSKIQDDIAKYIGLSLVGHEGEGNRRLALRDALSNTRFLLVLDDLQCALDLDAIGIPSALPEGRSKIVITSRSARVGWDMGADMVIDVPALPEQQAWELFRNAVGDAALKDMGAEEMARALVRGCGGLPSALVGFAKAMKDARSTDEWRHYSEHPHLLREFGVGVPEKSTPADEVVAVRSGMVHVGGGRFYLREDIGWKNKHFVLDR